MAAKFVIKRSSGGKYFFNLKAGNGRILLSSEMYESKAAVINAIRSAMSNAVNDARYLRKTSSNGRPYFFLQAANGMIIGMSEIYDSTAAMEDGIQSIKMTSAQMDIRDLTTA